MNLEALLVREEENILIVTINRPEALNALNESVINGLESLLGWINSKSTPPGAPPPPRHLRGMVITGSGEKAFVAGADIKQFEDMSPKAATDFASRGQQLFSKIESLRFPVIAAVNGFALGGGLELALACDFIYASENAKFSLPECTLGIMPGFGGTVRLPRRIGQAKALEMAMSGAMITAAEALICGLVNKVVPQADLLKATLDTAKICASRAPLAMGMIKDSIHRGMNTTEAQANEIEARLFGEIFASEDKSEGVKAFIGKRKPSFQGK